MKRIFLFTTLAMLLFISCGGGPTETATETAIETPMETEMETVDLSKLKEITDFETGKKYYYGEQASIYDSKGKKIYIEFLDSRYSYEIIDYGSEYGKIVFIIKGGSGVGTKYCSGIYNFVVLNAENGKVINFCCGLDKISFNDEASGCIEHLCTSLTIAGCEIVVGVEDLCSIEDLKTFYKEYGCDNKQESYQSTSNNDYSWINGKWNMSRTYEDGRSYTTLFVDLHIDYNRGTIKVYLAENDNSINTTVNGIQYQLMYSGNFDIDPYSNSIICGRFSFKLDTNKRRIYQNIEGSKTYFSKGSGMNKNYGDSWFD